MTHHNGLETLARPASVNSQLQEALVMAGMVSLRNDLSVELGQFWAFNWKTNVITIPLAELHRCPGEEICWIILHEAAHAALTRLHHMLPAETLGRPEIQILLNAVEDVRIENWLVKRFPGSLPWKQVTDAIANQDAPDSAEAADMETPPVAFLRGLMRFGETGEVPTHLNPMAREALEAAVPALQLAFDCVPPASAVGSVSVERLYENHSASLFYSEIDRVTEPSPFEKWVRIMQASMWFHVAGGVLPFFLKLVQTFGCPALPQQRVVRRAGASAQPGKQRSAGELQRALRAELANGGSSRYAQTVVKYAEQIRSITETLLLLLPNHRGLRHVRGCATGARLDLRTAAQFEADPRLHDRLWMQRRRRTLPDPAFVFLVDRSGSMENDAKSVAAFETLVLLRETCTRAGIPFSATMFHSHPELIHDWEQLNDEAAEAALSAVLRPDGGTSIAAAMRFALETFTHRRERDRIIFLMTDGDVSPQEKEWVRKLKHEAAQAGIRVLAFGVGEESENIAEMFPDAALLRSAEALPVALAASLLKIVS